LNKDNPNLDTDIDPKLSWALRNLEHFPVDINIADKRMLARIPGIGMKSVYKIIQARRYRKLNWEHLKAIGIAFNRAKYFMVCESRDFELKDRTAGQIKGLILQESQSKFKKTYSNQLNLFGATESPVLI
jgi:predicted DNA-binding helix-hairpin-helix protein